MHCLPEKYRWKDTTEDEKNFGNFTFCMGFDCKDMDYKSILPTYNIFYYPRKNKNYDILENIRD